MIVVSALGVSALCSILEATLLSSSRVKLARRRDAGDQGATVLLDLKSNHLDDSISAILTYNTIAHTVGAALSGAQAAVVFGDRWVGVFSGVLTLLILLFTEIVPKTVGTVYCDRLAGFAGRTIAVMIKPPMKWVLYVTRAITRLIARKQDTTVTRGDVAAMVKIAARDGAIDDDESTVLSNLLRLEDIAVRDVMTPRTVMATFDQSSELRSVLAAPEARAFSRLPVFKESRDAVLGYVLMRELLTAALDDEASLERDLVAFVRPVDVVDETLSVGDALQQLTRDSAHMAVVLDDLGVLSGLVTLEDLFETAMGTEITDELDEVVDLRKVAIELRDKRLARLRARREEAGLEDELPSGSPTPPASDPE